MNIVTYIVSFSLVSYCLD